ncbi:MAG: xanthine dehydrogenase family protein molybdopterin-binding subunit [Acidimicrobiia bacterium]|nr:xanthine dehydrogenase family protein molybdopterin-binding subunit [Acidimicrobiia bacterium]MYG59768.1 xanthine dehydrogenase family protein molybdopterin-binding subunit [Acidimicrobiia bacterium]MYJ31546.1 xanthine dehydrogenase family protein molybdopterin-binding subunit [Acidimicrobiia bacterium]
MSILGNEVRRVEDPRMLTDGGTYVADIPLDGAAHVVFVRSPIAHARLLSVEANDARTMPGVIDVVVGDDLDLSPLPPMAGDAAMARPLLATGRVRFVGEAVAAVVAETVEQATDAAEAVWADYDPLPVVVDAETAAEGPKLFDDAESNVAIALPPTAEVDFSECDVVISHRVVNSKIYASPIEGRVAAAAWGEDGRLTCWSSTQGAHTAQGAIAGALGLDPSQVRVIIPDVGGGFGTKASPGAEECLLGWLARRTGRPVRWAETRTESLQSLGHSRAQFQTVTLGGTAAGRFTHYRLDMLADAGAYPGVGALLPTFTGLMACGNYDIANVAWSATAVATNTSPVNAFRGAGRPEATAAIERAVDLFAAEIDMDPAELRRRNYLAPDAFPLTTPTGAAYDSGDYRASLEAALEAADYDGLRAEQTARREQGDHRLLGIGMATYVEVTSPMGPVCTETGSLELRPDGTVLARTGATPFGQGHVTTLSMVVADTLGIDMDQIEMIHGDTDEIPTSDISGGSRTAQIAGSALLNASEKLIEAARPRAADLLEAAPADVVLDSETGQFHVVGTPARSTSWADVAAADSETLFVENDFEQHGATFPFGTHVAVVEVDADTGEVTLERLVAVDDAGFLLNPLLAHGQIHGGLAAGAAQALMEEVHYDPDGNLLTSNFADYGVISTTELPSFEVHESVTPTPLNPLGAKGIGESGTVGSTPAVQNAVIDALSHLGIRHLDMPASPEKVWTAIASSTG